MSPGVFLAVLLAAALHAAWNAVVKVGEDRLVAVTLITLFSALAGAAAIPLLGLPQPEALPWLALSVMLHTGYRIFLAQAYSTGDLGQVYPLARGTAPLLVALAAVTLFEEPLARSGLIGIVLLSAGIVALTLRGAGPRTAPGLHASLFALATSLCIAGYTLTDGFGARLNQSPHVYAAWLFFLDGVAIWAIAAIVRRDRLVPALARHWRAGLAAGVMSAAAYWIVIWAMTRAPVALVAALRESSVLFGALISVLILREPLSLWRASGAALILIGVVLIRLG